MQYISMLYLAAPLLLLILGFVSGRVAEMLHYRSLVEREKQCFQVPVVTARGLLEARAIQEARLVLGAAVISVDYYKRFLSGFRKIFGGELHSYSALIDRGRREALLRMRAEFPDADLYLNCRLETASVFKGYGQAMGSIEVVAYATAIKYRA